MTAQLLEVRDLRVYYGAARALHGISFDVRRGRGRHHHRRQRRREVDHPQDGLGRVRAAQDGRGRGHLHGQAGRAPARPPRWPGMGMAHVPEGRRVFPASSVEDNLMLGGYCRRKQRKSFGADLDAIYERFPVLGERQRPGRPGCSPAASSRCSPSAGP